MLNLQDNIAVQVDHGGESLEQVHDFKFLGSYKSADGDFTKEIKRHIAMARQGCCTGQNLERPKYKNCNETQSDEVNGVGSIQYRVDGWTLKKSDRNRIEAFKTWCWRKMLSISWQEHRTNDLILTELGLERELMGRVAKLKLQYFGHITR